MSRNPKLDRYIVVRKHVNSAWPITRDLIIAKQQYDLGEVEICTGRDGDELILYAIPRKQIAKGRTPYFFRGDS